MRVLRHADSEQVARRRVRIFSKGSAYWPSRTKRVGTRTSRYKRSACTTLTFRRATKAGTCSTCVKSGRAAEKPSRFVGWLSHRNRALQPRSERGDPLRNAYPSSSLENVQNLDPVVWTRDESFPLAKKYGYLNGKLRTSSVEDSAPALPTATSLMLSKLPRSESPWRATDSSASSSNCSQHRRGGRPCCGRKRRLPRGSFEASHRFALSDATDAGNRLELRATRPSLVTFPFVDAQSRHAEQCGHARC